MKFCWIRHFFSLWILVFGWNLFFCQIFLGWKYFLGWKFFLGQQIFWSENFFGQQYFWSKFFCVIIFLGSKIFLGLDFFWVGIFFWVVKFFLGQTFAHTGPSAQPPIYTIGNFPVHMSAESPSNISHEQRTHSARTKKKNKLGLSCGKLRSSLGYFKLKFNIKLMLSSIHLRH